MSITPLILSNMGAGVVFRKIRISDSALWDDDISELVLIQERFQA